MPRPPATTRRSIERWSPSKGAESADDLVAVEAPLELRVNGAPKVLMMRTPGHDEELCQGLLFGEGIVRAGEPRPVLTRPADEVERDNVMNVDLPVDLVAERWPDRGLYANSACGICGRSSIDALALRAEAVRPDTTFTPAQVVAMPAALQKGQDIFQATGGLHAAGLFDQSAAPSVVREDVGRHNAVDKVIGWALGEGRPPLSENALCVSGRTSYEILQKAVVAGVGLVVAVSAPSSLAIDIAERFQVTLCGFTRDGRFNIYSHGIRVAT